MSLIIDDPAIEAAVQKLAAERRQSPADVIREALRNEVARCGPTFDERVDAIVQRLKAYPKTGLKADKAFFDELSGDA